MCVWCVLFRLYYELPLKYMYTLIWYIYIVLSSWSDLNPNFGPSVHIPGRFDTCPLRPLVGNCTGIDMVKFDFCELWWHILPSLVLPSGSIGDIFTSICGSDPQTFAGNTATLENEFTSYTYDQVTNCLEWQVCLIQFAIVHLKEHVMRVHRPE